MDRVTAPGYQHRNNTDNRELQITNSQENAKDYGVCLAEIVYSTRTSSTPAQHHPSEAAQRSSQARHDGKLWDDPRRHTKPSPAKNCTQPDLQPRCPRAGAHAQPPPHLEEMNYLQKKRYTSSCTANMPVTPAPAMMAAQRCPRTASWCCGRRRRPRRGQWSKAS